MLRFLFVSLGAIITKTIPNKSRSDPCPASPNINPNKKGNVTMDIIAGFAS
jgi:hypothetical protein